MILCRTKFFLFFASLIMSLNILAVEPKRAETSQSVIREGVIPLLCRKQVRFPDGDLRNYEFEILVDENKNNIMRSDGSLLASAEDVEVSDRYIRYVIRSDKSTNSAIVDRVTGRYSDESYIHVFQTKVIGSGSCQLFNVGVRRF